MFEAIRRYSQELSMVPNRPVVSPPLVSPLGAGPAPLEKNFHSLEFRIQCGHWKVFNSRSSFGNKDASVLVFDKKINVKAPPRIGRMNKFALSDLIKYEVSQLNALIHPRILHMEHQMEETKDYMAFATELIVSTLDTVVSEEGVDRLETKLGVLQIIDGVSYLHNSAKVLHGNLTPAAVYVTSTRAWKIGGFMFAVAAKEPNMYPCFPWTKKLPPCLQPDLDFLAPEYLASGQTTVTQAADVFSLGVLICWIYGGGKRLIDAKNNLETYQIVIDQLDAALNCISNDLGPNLKDSMSKVLSSDVEVRPTVQLLSLIKHFDDPALSALRQLDDISQVFDPSQKSHFLSQTLHSALATIPENVWFTRVLPRFDEQLLDLQEMYLALAKPLFFMLEHCESHNIPKLRTWIRKIVDNAVSQKPLRSFVLDNMSVLFRRLSDDIVEDKCLDIIVHSLRSEDTSTQSSVIRGIPHVAEFLPIQFIVKKLLPTVMCLPPYLHDNVPRQLDLLAALAAISDRCDATSLVQLLQCVSLCSAHHPVIIHAKSRIVQRIVTRDPVRLRDAQQLCVHLLNPLVIGLACKDLSSAHFDDVLSSVRILLDVVEQLRYEHDDRQYTQHLGLGGRGLGNRRVSMSSTNLPRVMISAARPSFSSDSRKMSFLSADGRLEDRGRRESRDSRGSLESDMSIRIGNGSDISDDSCHSGNSARGRRQSWLDGYGHSVSLEQNTNSFLDSARNNDRNLSFKQRTARCSERRARTRSPNSELESRQPPARPNSFTNLGHNLVLTYKTLWNKDH